MMNRPVMSAPFGFAQGGLRRNICRLTKLARRSRQFTTKSAPTGDPEILLDGKTAIMV